MMSQHHQTYRDRACVEFKLPCRFLNENKLTFVVTPDLIGIMTLGMRYLNI